MTTYNLIKAVEKTIEETTHIPNCSVKQALELLLESLKERAYYENLDED